MRPPVSATARLNRLLVFVEMDGANPGFRKEAIREALKLGYWDTARKLADVGLNAQPADAELLSLSGVSHLSVHHYGEAEEAFAAALSRGADSAGLRYSLAFARFGERRYSESLSLLTPEIVEALPAALPLRARCQHYLRETDEAIETCTAHLAITDFDAETHGLLSLLLYERGRSEEAIPHADAALRCNPKQVDAMLVSVSLRAASRNYGIVRRSLDALLQSNPRCGRAWLGLALVELTRLQRHAAKRNMHTVALDAPEHAGRWHVLAWANIMLGDILSAEADFGRALAQDRSFGQTHGGLAVCAALQGRESEARVGIKRALHLDPQSMSACYAQILLMQRAGQHEEARRILDAVPPSAPSQTKVADHLANTPPKQASSPARPDPDTITTLLH